MRHPTVMTFYFLSEVVDNTGSMREGTLQKSFHFKVEKVAFSFFFFLKERKAVMWATSSSGRIRITTVTGDLTEIT